MPVQVQEAFRTPNRKTGKELPLPYYNKIINMQIKESALRGEERTLTRTERQQAVRVTEITQRKP